MRVRCPLRMSFFVAYNFCCSNMSKIAQAERKAKARFQALLRRRRFSRRSLKDREPDFRSNASKITVNSCVSAG